MARAGIQQRRAERGVSFLLVVAGMFSILAMAALAVDIVIMYLAKSEAQKAADAAALAGAKMFVLSGITSGSGVNNICSGAGTDASNLLASAVAGVNQVGGTSAAVTNVACNLANPQNPQITVTVSRTDLPTFFGRIFGKRSTTVSATATAEAFNNSGSTTQLQVGSVKPWLIPNCDPGQVPPSGCPYFVDSANNYVLNNPSAFIGHQFSFQMRNQVNPPGKSQYYMIDLPAATICPSTNAPGCLGVGGGVGTAGYLDTIACANTNRLQCGDTVNLDKLNGSAPNITDTISGTQCLIHTTSTGPGGTEQDQFSPSGTLPVTITGGLLNPNPAFVNTQNISRSDSVVTVPLFDWTVDPCPTAKCGTEIVMGFLQFGILDVQSAPATAAGNIDAVVLNAVGCNPAGSTGTPISGGGLTALPVRLIQ
jgi:hypothetical protein